MRIGIAAIMVCFLWPVLLGADREIIGKWFDDGGLNPGLWNLTITIVKEGKKYYEENSFEDLPKVRRGELKRSETSEHIRFDLIANAAGEYNVIVKKTRELRMYDKDGYIRSAKPIKYE